MNTLKKPKPRTKVTQAPTSTAKTATNLASRALKHNIQLRADIAWYRDHIERALDIFSSKKLKSAEDKVESAQLYLEAAYLVGPKRVV